LDWALGEPVAAPWSVKMSSKVFVADASSFLSLGTYLPKYLMGRQQLNFSQAVTLGIFVTFFWGSFLTSGNHL
jgi:hypothetical protein